MCLALSALSLSSVMAGSGDIDCLRTLRELRWRYEDVSFGTHMALSMAIGELIAVHTTENEPLLMHRFTFCI